MQDRLSTYDEKVLRRLIQLETARRQEGRQAPLAFIKRDTEAGAAMRRLDQMGMIGAIYKEGNPYVVESGVNGLVVPMWAISILSAPRVNESSAIVKKTAATIGS